MKHDGTRLHIVGPGAILLAVFLAGGPALAQDAPQEPPAAPPASPDATPAGDDATPDAGDADAIEAEDEVIVVTGSRIRTDPLDAQSPVLQVGSEDIERSGQTSVADLLQQLPVSGGALNTRFNSSGNFGFPPDGGGIGAGAAEADMRYLGSKRVLVLVDGVRWINGASASGVPAATDLNTIPLGIIDRIEVLEDGASPIYGSDAIAGVINIITKKNWEGARANAYLGGYNQGDGFTQEYDVSWASKNDRMTMMMSMSYVDQRRVSANDREISRFAIPVLGRCTNSSCSSGTPEGRFVLVDPNTGTPLDMTRNPGVDNVPRYDELDPYGPNSDFNEFDTDDRFNFAPFNLVLTPSRRFGAFSGVEYKLADRVFIGARALYNHRDSVNQAAPEPIFIGPDAGNGNRLDRVVVHESNIYNPFGFSIDPATNPSYFIGRRPLEAGPRIFEQSVNTFYVSGGLRGDFKIADRRFFWDATAAYGLNRADQLKHGAFNAAKLEKALGPDAACAADPECVPFNIFGGQGRMGTGSITRDMLDYVTFVQKDVSQQELVDLLANVSGDLFRLPGGAVGVAAGVEHRRQSGFFQPDAVVVAGDSAGVPSQPTSGSFDVTEGYAEVRVPVAARIPGANLLDLSGAVRVSNYSTFGTESTFKTGLRWRPIADLLLRGNYAQGFRAPGIGELFGSAARFDQTLMDPCSGLTEQSPNYDACSALGVPVGYEQLNPQISVTTGGNPALEPETSTSITASLVYGPSWLERSASWLDKLDIELTYYRIDLDDAIAAIDAEDQLNLCVRDGSPDSVFCQGITRTPSGVINGFSNQLTNIGGIRTQGLDVTLNYLSPKTAAGRFRLTWISSFLLEFTELIPATEEGQAEEFVEIAREGTEVGDPERAFPRYKSRFIVDNYFGELRSSITFRYIHSVTEPCTGLRGFDPEGDLLCSDYDVQNLGEEDEVDNSTNVLSPTLYGDVQVTYTPRALDNLLDLTVGVNNVFNQDPPPCFSCALNGFDATTYDIPGVFGYVKAGYRMY